MTSEELHAHGIRGVNIALKGLPQHMQDRLHEYAQTKSEDNKPVDYAHMISSKFSQEHPSIIKRKFPEGIPDKLTGAHTGAYRNVGRNYALQNAAHHLLISHVREPHLQDKIKTNGLVHNEDLRSHNIKGLLKLMVKDGTPLANISYHLADALNGIPMNSIKEEIGGTNAKLFELLHKHITEPNYSFDPEQYNNAVKKT